MIQKKEELSIILKLPYMGPEGEKLVKTLRKKISKNISKKTIYQNYLDDNKNIRFLLSKRQNSN